MPRIAIFCEGGSDINFLKNFITHLAKSNQLTACSENPKDFVEQSIFPYIMGGKDNFFNPNHPRYTDVKMRIDNAGISRILFVIDADNERTNQRHGGYDRTQSELNKVITELGLESISQTYIMCDPITNEGHLESFILSTLPVPQQNCVKSFLGCFQLESKEVLKTVVNDIYKTAYPTEHYNFEHDNFNKLKTILKNFLA